MFRYLGILLAARWQVFWNGIKHAKTGEKIGMAFIAALVLFFMVLSFLFAFVLGSLPNLIRSIPAEQISRLSPDFHISDVSDAITRIITFIFVAAFIVLLFSGFNTALSSLYLSGDMELLLVAPIPMRAVFISKFIAGLSFTYLLLLGFGIPYLIGTGLGLGYHWSYYPIAIFALLALPLVPSGLSALATVALVRVLPPGRIREILAVFGALIGVSFYLLGQLPSLLRGNGAVGSGTAALVSRLGGIDLTFLPPAWGANAMQAAGEANWQQLLLWGGLYFGVSLILYIICLIAAERLYYSGWANVNIVGGKSRARLKADRARRAVQAGANQGYIGAALPTFSGNGAAAANPVQRIADPPLAIERQAAPPQGLFAHGVSAILGKDATMLRRDPTGLTQLIWPVAISVVFMLQINQVSSPSAGLSGGGYRQFSNVVSSLRFLAPTAIVLFASSGIGAYFGISAFSRERKAIWMLKTAPVSAGSLLLGKFIVAYVPFAVFGIGLSVAYGLVSHFDLFAQLASTATVLLLGLGLTGIAVGLGGIAPRFDWDNPQRQNSTTAGCLYFPLFIIYALLAGGALLGGVALGAAIPAQLPLFVALGVLLSIAITALAIWLPLRLAADRFEQLEI